MYEKLLLLLCGVVLVSAHFLEKKIKKQKPDINVWDVVDFFLLLAPKDEEGKHTIHIWKFSPLLYLAQVKCLDTFGFPLFEDKITKITKGVIISSVFIRMNGERSNWDYKNKHWNFPEGDLKDMLCEVFWNFYLSDEELLEMVRRQESWINTPVGEVITFNKNKKKEIIYTEENNETNK